MAESENEIVKITSAGTVTIPNWVPETHGHAKRRLRLRISRNVIHFCKKTTITSYLIFEQIS